jgi:hypothetical protein
LKLWKQRLPRPPKGCAQMLNIKGTAHDVQIISDWGFIAKHVFFFLRGETCCVWWRQMTWNHNP